MSRKLSDLERAVIEAAKEWWKQREAYRGTEDGPSRGLAWAQLEASLVVFETAMQELMAENTTDA